jgi:hypothetical protein
MLNFFGGGLTLYYLNIKIRKMKENVIFNKVGILFKKKFLKKIQQNIIKSIIREYFNKICYPYLEKENFDIENFFIHKKIIDFNKVIKWLEIRKDILKKTLIFVFFEMSNTFLILLQELQKLLRYKILI